MVFVSGLLAAFRIFNVDWSSVLLAYVIFTQYRLVALFYLLLVVLWLNLMRKAGRNLLFVSHYRALDRKNPKE